MNISIKSIRNRGVSLVVFETADPAQSMTGILRDLNGDTATVPLMQWDIMRSLVGLNDAGKKSVKKMIGEMPPETLCDPSACLAALGKCDDKQALVFVLNAHRYWGDADRMQGIWNIRDAWKAIGATLVLIVDSAATLPSELRSDVLVQSEPVPTEEIISEVIDSVTRDAGMTVNPQMRGKVIDTLLGYQSKFAVEQAFALGLEKTGPNIDRLWQLRVQALKNTAGLEITLPTDKYDKLGGCAGVKSFLTSYINGRRPPRCVFWLDEIEKMLAGSGTDTSGVTQKQLEHFLFWTESEKVDAALLLGVPGAGKSWTAHTTAGQAGVPLVRGSMSSAQSQYVGVSTAQTSTMLKAVSAIGQGRILMLATCNSFDTLPPEVIARFKLGTFFYDYPSEVEQADIAALNLKKYELRDKWTHREQWVGREVESCCHRAWLFRTSVAKAAETVVPVSMASKSKMDALRNAASGRFNAAGYVGVYDVERKSEPAATGRKMSIA